MLEAPSRLDRAEGDLHPKGNPHYLLDPMYGENCRAKYRRRTDSKLSPASSRIRQKSESLYCGARHLDRSLGKNGGAFARRKICGIPSGVDLLADRFGMKRVGSVELKPGIEPTPNHLVQLAQQIKQEKAQVADLRRAESAHSAADLQGETGIKVLRLYSGAGGRPRRIATSNGSIILCAA